MSKSRLELKVGIFVAIALALIGALLLQFSKGMSLFRGTYEIRLTAQDVGGLKLRAAVLMSGVQVGTVSDIQLASDGKSVTIVLSIYNRFRDMIHKDAIFVIESAGFLGDQYVAIKPTQNLLPTFQHGDTAVCQTPLNIQEVARSASSFIQHVDEAARMLNSTIADVRRLVLNDETLTNLSAAVHSMRDASDNALSALNRLDVLIATNGSAITASASNLVSFSEGLDQFSGSLNGVLNTNGASISVAVKNIEDSTVILKRIMQDVDSGKGLAGTVLHDEKVAANLADILHNLSITTSNMNQLGLWKGVLFPRTPKPVPPPGQRLQSPRDQGG
jgi:phospholipid/cholesterol/gamma-HCH transport system substrate-binding protein